MGFQCPKCGRELLNRRKPTCSFCGANVPQNVRMTGSQAAKIEQLKADEARAHREFMDRPASTGGTDAIIWIPDIPSF